VKRALDDIHFSKEEMQRYGRHFVLPSFGVEGQKILKNSSVLIVGAGGLGSPAASYLSAAGVGRIGIVDCDNVDASNLQRQLLYSTSDVGKPKVLVAVERLRAINPDVELTLYRERLTSRNALEILSSYDVIVDGSDNLPTRYLVNDACVILKKPDVYGAVFQFEGQASVFDSRTGPCYRCLFPEPPPPELVQSCAESGVLGMLPGIIGNIQAAETVKILANIGQSLVGRLLLLDATAMDFREVRIERQKGCPVCGENPTIHELIDYEEFCGMTKGGETLFLLDVREPFEYEIVHLDATLVPLHELPKRFSDLDDERETIVYCHTGVRSRSAVEFLKSNGFKNVKNLTGGIEAWAREVDPTIERY
jgi:molybdopterin/thiamine biosynthesis adenylyltransferase/rhodanese-related sulfurtransferase